MTRTTDLLFLALALTPVIAGCAPANPIAIVGRDFVDVRSHRPFHPRGFNYDRDYRHRLLEDYWADEWPTVQADFAEMRRLGASVVRIHLQVARFMDGPDHPNAANLARLRRLLDLARDDHLRLDLTGLACYRRTDVPTWYAGLGEPSRWRTQAAFWSAIARTCANHPALFCYDLVNEPAVPAEPRTDWLTGDLAGFTYCQFIALDAKGRDRTQLAIDWTRQMTTAIRAHDHATPITVGLLPFPRGAGFEPTALAPHLDFISVHYYPDQSNLDKQLTFLRQFAVADKPLIVEEIFPLKTTPDDVVRFIERADFVTGWISFYWGPPLATLDRSASPGDALIAAWLRTFSHNNPNASKIPATEVTR